MRTKLCMHFECQHETAADLEAIGDALRWRMLEQYNAQQIILRSFVRCRRVVHPFIDDEHSGHHTRDAMI